MDFRKTRAYSSSVPNLAHLVEPIDPRQVAPELRNTPGFVARLLDSDLFRSYRTRPHSRRTQQALPSITTHAFHQNEHAHPMQPASPMDTLANTALTTSPTYKPILQAGPKVSRSQPASNNKRSYKGRRGPGSTLMDGEVPGGHSQINRGQKRPAKRARSEALPSPLLQHTSSRPATSHNPVEQPSSSQAQGAHLGHRARQPSQDELDIGSFLQELANRRRNDFTPHPNPASLHQPKVPSMNGFHDGEQDVDDWTGPRQGDKGHQVVLATTLNNHEIVTQNSHGFAEDSSDMKSGVQTSVEYGSIYGDNISAGMTRKSMQTQTPPDENVPEVTEASVALDAMEGVQSTVPMGPPSRRASRAGEQSRELKVPKSTINNHRKLSHSDLTAQITGSHQLESPQSILNDDSSLGHTQVEENSSSFVTNNANVVRSIELAAPESLSHTTSAPGSPRSETPHQRARWASSPPKERESLLNTKQNPESFKVDTRTPRPKRMRHTTTCAACSYSSNSTTSEIQQWIQCNGCKQWFHFVCVGFKSERDIRSIDKFHCLECRNEFGPTTYVRKSKRTHVSVDYAKLTEGVVQTGDDTTEHHFVQAIKAGEISLRTENFPRMRPEEVTADYFAKCKQLSEPVVIPACWNPRPGLIGSNQPLENHTAEIESQATTAPFKSGMSWDTFSSEVQNEVEDKVVEPETVLVADVDSLSQADDKHYNDTSQQHEPLHSDLNAVDIAAIQRGADQHADRVQDLGQDYLGMVIPHGLTIKHVAELYGQHERLPVIEVKTQQVSDQPWTVGKWAEYYDDPSPDKIVRNVISLEVSQSPLGRLLRRPDFVRDLDLADSVWPKEEGPGPKVGFYVLMSVKDSFTDFHIDFGGSSVYYHIVKGKKTFFFIPPKPKYLKIYEEWNKSAAQNYIWLGNETKECYRVDLSAGDTMIIPAGWIHSVWTPDHSLVVGGNFLTRLHYSTQFKIVDIEKATNVSLKYRFPYFQKVMWYTILKYLDDDPLPAVVEMIFLEGRQFIRSRPIFEEYNKFGHNSDSGPENYNARYYPEAEINGLPDLLSFIFRTVMIQLGRVDGITVEKQNAVGRSIPKHRGDPLDNARKFAMWVAWKRGNEDIPQWAHPDAVLPEQPEGSDKAKKLSAAALKKLEKAKAIECYMFTGQDGGDDSQSESPSGWSNNHYASPKNSVLGPKRSACDACRKRRVACKHKMEVRDASMVNGLRQYEFVGSNKASLHGQALAINAPMTVYTEDQQLLPQPTPVSMSTPVPTPELAPEPMQLPAAPAIPVVTPALESSPVPVAPPLSAQVPATPTVDIITAPSRHVSTANGMAAVHGVHTPLPRETRNKACAQCRKSKRRCLHDENGQLDPSKLAEATKKPPHIKKRSSTSNGESSAKKVKREVLEMMDFPTIAQAPVAVMTSSRGEMFSDDSNALPAAQISLLRDFTSGPRHPSVSQGEQPETSTQWDIDPALMDPNLGVGAPSMGNVVFEADSSNATASHTMDHSSLPYQHEATDSSQDHLQPTLENSAMAAMHAMQSMDSTIDEGQEGRTAERERSDVHNVTDANSTGPIDPALDPDVPMVDSPGGHEDYMRLLASQEFGLRRRT